MWWVNRPGEAGTPVAVAKGRTDSFAAGMVQAEAALLEFEKKAQEGEDAAVQ